MPGSAHSQLVTESNSARPQSAPGEEVDQAPGGVGDQRVCGREAGEAPHSAPASTGAFGDWLWRMAEFALDRFEVWDCQRPTRGELMEYARTGPYTLPTVVTTNAKGGVVRHITKLRRLGIAYHKVVSTNLHSLVYAALWLLRQPSRALAKTSRPTLEQILGAVRDTSGPAQWVNVGIFVASTAAYALLWVVERPIRVPATGAVVAILRAALLTIGL